MTAVAKRCQDRGNEVDVVWTAEFLTMIELWSGRWAEAARTADDAMEREGQIGGHLMTITAHFCQAAVAAYTGRADTPAAPHGPPRRCLRQRDRVPLFTRPRASPCWRCPERITPPP